MPISFQYLQGNIQLILHFQTKFQPTNDISSAFVKRSDSKYANQIIPHCIRWLFIGGRWRAKSMGFIVVFDCHPSLEFCIHLVSRTSSARSVSDFRRALSWYQPDNIDEIWPHCDTDCVHFGEYTHLYQSHWTYNFEQWYKTNNRKSHEKKWSKHQPSWFRSGQKAMLTGSPSNSTHFITATIWSGFSLLQDTRSKTCLAFVSILISTLIARLIPINNITVGAVIIIQLIYLAGGKDYLFVPKNLPKSLKSLDPNLDLELNLTIFWLSSFTCIAKWWILVVMTTNTQLYL